MPSKPTVPGHRLSPADLTPEQRARYEQLRVEAKALRESGALGPPADVDMTDAAPFYFALLSCIGQLRKAREAAGLTLAEVSTRTGLAAETLSRLETGAATNPTWQTLGLFAAAVGCRLTVSAEPA